MKVKEIIRKKKITKGVAIFMGICGIGVGIIGIIMGINGSLTEIILDGILVLSSLMLFDGFIFYLWFKNLEIELEENIYHKNKFKYINENKTKM